MSILPLPRHALLFDVDGTLCNVESIRHHVVLGHPENQGYRDFYAFHRASTWCPPHEWVVVAAIEAINAGVPVLVGTARKEQWRSHTRGWLDSHIPGYEKLYMRPDWDDRPDRDVKLDMLRRIRYDGYWVDRAWDDNPRIVALWKELGIPVTEVPGWLEEERAA